MICAVLRRFVGSPIWASRGLSIAGCIALSVAPIAAAPAAVTKSVARVYLAALTQPYTGAPRNAEVTTTPAGLKARVAYNAVETAPVLPGRYRITASVEDAQFSGSATGIMTVTVTALVRHAPDIEGAVDGSVEVTSAENLLLDGRASISGDLLVPGAPSLDLAGFPMIVGAVDANGVRSTSEYSVFLRDNAILRYLVRHVDPLPIPTVVAPTPGEGASDLALTDRANDAVDWHDVRDISVVADIRSVSIPPGSYGRLTLAGDAPVILGAPSVTAPAVYRFDAVAIRAGAHLRVMSPIVLVVADTIDVDGDLGDSEHARWVTAAISKGGLLLGPGSRFAGLVLAPAGEVTIGVGARLTGQVIADRLQIGVDGALVDPAQ